MSDFLDVVHSLHRVKTPAKIRTSVSVKTPKVAKPQYKVVKAAGFTKYKDYVADLIKKLKGVPVTA
ncbi:hypothetical protein ACQZ2G_06280 [Pseudomonas viridiflava]|uniref:hypothetical protein n=1 Tax=Pseudomonas viridiflava TaxID=33069 RepID=UPI0011AF9395